MRCLHFTLARRHACFCVALQSLSTYANAAALDGYTLLTDTDAVTPPMPPPNWIPFGSGKVAVGYDCPFLADGDTTDIAACQASCIANSQCNEINAEASGSGSGLTACILRFCSDPFSPQLSPYPQAWSSYGLNRSATCECGVHVFAMTCIHCGGCKRLATSSACFGLQTTSSRHGTRTLPCWRRCAQRRRAAKASTPTVRASPARGVWWLISSGTCMHTVCPCVVVRLFAAAGWLKLNTTVTVASPGTNVWVKKAPPACPPLRGPHVEGAAGNCQGHMLLPEPGVVPQALS